MVPVADLELVPGEVGRGLASAVVAAVAVVASGAGILVVLVLPSCKWAVDYCTLNCNTSNIPSAVQQILIATILIFKNSTFSFTCWCYNH